MDGVVSGRDGERAAFNVQGLLRVDCVVDAGTDGKRDRLDGERGSTFFVGRCAGLDAVFAVGIDR